jgi:hypothetical protein
MKTFLKTLTGRIAAFVAGLAMVGTLVYAQSQGSFYAGYWPQTNQNGLVGTLVSGGTTPTVSGTTGCGTIASVKGGSSHGEFVIGTFATSCAITLTLPAPTIVVSNNGGTNGNGGGAVQTNSTALPNGLDCSIKDLTTGADTTYQVSYSNSGTLASCTFNAATFVTGDKLLYSINGY